MIFNDRLDAALALFFMVVVLVVIAASAREWWLVAAKQQGAPRQRGALRGDAPGYGRPPKSDKPQSRRDTENLVFSVTL